MKNLELTVDNIKELMTGFSKSTLSSFALEDGDFKLHMESNKTQGTVTSYQPAHPVQPSPAAEEAPAASGNVVVSPLVGTFYVSAAPDKPPFIKIGQKVKKGDILFIVESMKLMNEIESKFDGVVTSILASNGDGVEYGQPLVTIE